MSNENVKREETVVALIPARYDSKRIPGKNIEDLGGIPLFEHSLRTAKKITCLSGVFISTESDLVRSRVEEKEYSVILRSEETSTYDKSNYDVILDALPKITDSIGKQPDLLLLLQPTHPFRCPNEVQKALDLMRASPEASSLIAVKEVDEAIGRDNGKYWDGLTSLSVNLRRKDEPLYQNTGNFYLIRIKNLIAGSDLLGDKIIMFPISLPLIDVNIDLPHELQLARLIQEQKYKLLGLEYNPVDN